MKIAKEAPEAKTMQNICHGTPNLYFLFAAMSLFNLKTNCEMVYIISRLWTSSAYFKKFREFFLLEGKINHIHLFISRDKVFDIENVLQETIIIKILKTKEIQENILITSTDTNKNFDDIKKIQIPYNTIVSGSEKYVYLVSDEREQEVLHKVNQLTKTLPELGLKMKTGLTVDFRNKKSLKTEKEENAIPLFHSQHIKYGYVGFPIQKEFQYIVTNQNGLRQENKNYLFVKKFTAKEEKRRFQWGM